MARPEATTKPQRARRSSLILKEKTPKFYLYSVHSLGKDVYFVLCRNFLRSQKNTLRTLWFAFRWRIQARFLRRYAAFIFR